MVETPTLAALFSRRAEGSAKAEAASGRPGLASSWPTSPPEKPRLGFFSGVTGRLLAVLLLTKWFAMGCQTCGAKTVSGLPVRYTIPASCAGVGTPRPRRSKRKSTATLNINT
jgi:hypothetical protein